MSPRPAARPKAKLVVLRPGDRETRRAAPRRPRSQREREAPGRNGSAPPDLLILHNTGSNRFTPEAMLASVQAVLDPRGLRHRMVAIPPGSEAEASVRRQVSRAIREGCTRIVAAGGDGTVGMVAQCLARRRGGAPVSLGIIPAGTTNLLARELGIPMSLDEAMAVIADADRAVELDAILVNRRFVFTQVGVGPDALMIRDTTRERQEKLGRLAYMLTFVRRAFGFRPRWFTLRLDGVVTRERAWQIVAANVGTVGAPPFTWGPRIDPTDGTLDICVFNVTRKRDFGKLIWRSMTGRHRRDENTRFFRVRERAVIESSQPILVQGDGEIIGRTPVTLRVVPAALRVLVARAVEGAVPAEPAAAKSEPAPATATEAAPEADEADATDREAGVTDQGREEGAKDLEAVTTDPEADETASEADAATATASPRSAALAAADAGAAPGGSRPDPAAADAAAPTVGENVEKMIGERSRTWLLQGRFRHPMAAIEAYDAAIFLRLNSLSLGTPADRALEALSRFIHYGEGWGIVVLLLLFVDLRQGLEAAVIALPALWATMITVNVPLKRVFRRRRPFLSFVKARVIGPRPRDFSFPSGHAAAGFAGAVLLGMFLPAWAPVFYLFALAVSFSRIYLGMHYPSDVVMGAFSGIVLAVAYRAILHLLLAGAA